MIPPSRWNFYKGRSNWRRKVGNWPVITPSAVGRHFLIYHQVDYLWRKGNDCVQLPFPFFNHLQHRKLVNLPYFLLEIRHMYVSVNIFVHLESCVTNHGLIKLIVFDALEREGKSWEAFMSRKTRTSSWKKVEIPDDVVEDVRETEE